MEPKENVAKEALQELVKNFENLIDEVKSKTYNEAQVCDDFIQPFFSLLGWDIENKSNQKKENRDVIQQARMVIDKRSKAPDYIFTNNGAPAFIVEAKKPSVDLNSAKDPAFQLRNYGWNKNEVQISVLTDFEEFSVYDCTIPPKEGDEPNVARLIKLKFNEYVENWDFLHTYFSKENVCKGSLAKLLKEKPAVGKRETVDEVFLKMIENWRVLLAQSLAKNNPDLTVKDLNYAVQMTIDRIVFFRIAEDRDFEEKEKLLGLTQEQNIYKKLLDKFMDADKVYNSGLFHFKDEKNRSTKTDTITPTLKIDNSVLKEMIEGIYPPKSQYDFSIIPVDILGQVYERFLGKVITIGANHEVTVEEKPEVRKAGGVYYTPKYIVEYIVQNTVGKLVEGKTPAEVAKLKILDPACGSGSFLIGAYQFLLDWHLDYYTSHNPDELSKQKNPPIRMISKDGVFDWILSLDKRREILLNNIYGVDIDRQAVEVAKLNLLLKVVEKVKVELSDKMQRILPDLGSNIKCGNSLIESDFYAGKQGLFDTEEMYRINTFDWDREFPEIIKWKDKDKRELSEGFGFDAVIGNPPYIRIQNMGDNEFTYYSKFRSALGNFDIYCLFVEKALDLIKTSGYASYILPHRFFKTDYGQGLRELINDTKSLSSIFDFDGYYVFNEASINTCVIVLNKSNISNYVDFLRIKKHNIDSQVISSLLLNSVRYNEHIFESGKVDRNLLKSDYWNFITEDKTNLYLKLLTFKKLGSLDLKIIVGLQTSSDQVYILKLIDVTDKYFTVVSKVNNKIYHFEKELCFPLLRGANVTKYGFPDNTDLLIFPYLIKDNKAHLIDKLIFEKSFPNIWTYLCEMKDILLKRANVNSISWYGYPYPKNLTLFNKSKIMTTVLSSYNSFTFDSKGEYYFVGGGNAGVYGIQIDDESKYLYLLGLLNSKLLNWFHHKIALRCYQTAYSYGKRFIEQLPIKEIDFKNKKDVERHDAMVRLVEQMLELNKRLQQAKTPDDKELLSRQIEATDRQIDGLVYELYELTPEEIALVEESSK